MTRPPRPGHVDVPPRTSEVSTRSLAALAAGHAILLVAALLLAGLLLAVSPDPATDRLRGMTVVSIILLSASLGALAFGQVLSVRRLVIHSRAVAAGRLDEPALAAGARRITLPVVLAFEPVILGQVPLVIAPLPPPLFAALVAVIAAALLLDLHHAAWIYLRLPRTTGIRPLPPGSWSRIRTGQSVVAAIHVGCAVAATIMLIATVSGEIDTSAPAPAVVQISAAATTLLVSFLLIVPVRRVANAVTTDHRIDITHLEALDRAARSFVRLRSLLAIAAALAVAAVLAAPADVTLAVGRAVPLLLVLGLTAGQVGSLTRINLADTAGARR
jgi:hypothetical protein